MYEHVEKYIQYTENLWYSTTYFVFIFLLVCHYFVEIYESIFPWSYIDNKTLILCNILLLSYPCRKNNYVFIIPCCIILYINLTMLWRCSKFAWFRLVLVRFFNKRRRGYNYCKFPVCVWSSINLQWPAIFLAGKLKFNIWGINKQNYLIYRLKNYCKNTNAKLYKLTEKCTYKKLL